MQRRFTFLLVLLSAVTIELIAQGTLRYFPSTEDFPNPERGFYRYSDTRSSNYTPLTVSELVGFRQNQTPFSANYQVASSLVFRYFFLEDFKDTAISQSYLTAIQADFDAARTAGVKVIPRFAYVDQPNDSGCGSFNCPPYGDAPKAQVLTHIEQLKPLLQANVDVIATVQMGFIGTWGENYYTDYFGDASQGPDFKLTDTNWADRIEVLEALLDAVPVSRSVQVRYPQMKQRTAYGINAPISSAPLVLAEAYNGSTKARIGFHNDCILASVYDFGTYQDYGNSSTPSAADTAILKPYCAADGRFVAVGGETCSDGFNPQNNCASSDPAAYGDAELRRMRYSYLNADYNNEVNNDWQDGGCMDDIKLNLGYRFELQTGTFSNSVAPGQVMNIDLDLINRGYAAPYNARDVEVVLRNATTGDILTAKLPDDPRYWFGGNTTHEITASLCVPASVPEGDYEVLLHLPDPMPSLRDRPEYAIRLANNQPNGRDVWEASTGYNDLGNAIAVVNTGNNNACAGEITFVPATGPLPVELLTFTAEAIPDAVQLNWSTASETNNEGFGIERSLDGNTFVPVTFVDAQGAPGVGAQYVYIDSSASVGAFYYYRLAQRDTDGTITYSSIVTAQITVSQSHQIPETALRISPIPTTSLLTLYWTEAPSENVELRLFDGTGREVLQLNNTTQVDLSNLPVGIYELRVKVKDNVAIRRVIKQ